MTRHGFLKFGSVIVFLAALTAIFTLCGALIRHERAESERRTQAEVQQFATQLQAGVMGAFEPLSRLGAWWILQGKPDDPEDWHSDAQ